MAEKAKRAWLGRRTATPNQNTDKRMREVIASVELVPGLSSRQLFSLCYGTERFLCDYHLSVNTCANPNIPKFRPNTSDAFERCLEFSLPIQAPSVIMRLVGGSDRVSVMERQCVAVLEDGTLLLRSEPRPQIGKLSGGFTSDVEVRMSDVVREGEVAGCRVLAQVQVAAPAAPYGMVTVIEKFMADTALQSVKQLLAMVEADALRFVEAGRGLVEAAVRENVESAPALHAFIGLVDEGGVGEDGVGARELTDDMSTTIFYDDRHDDILREIEGLKDEVSRLSTRLDAALGSAQAPLRVVLDFEPVLLACVVAAGAIFAISCKPWQFNRG